MLSIDPGTKDMGWALWTDEKLTDCGIARAKDWITTVRMLPDVNPERLYIEDQQIYRSSNINAHSLIAVARVVGAVVMRFSDSPTLREVHIIKPREWKGQVPKDICNKRTIARLSDAERTILTKKSYRKTILHNLLDAVGIGLWALGRK